MPNKYGNAGNRRRKIKRHLKMPLIRQKDLCYYCGVKIYHSSIGLLPIATADHRQPVSKGGKDYPQNIVAACKKCNEFKADMTELEFWEIMKRSDHGISGISKE